MRNIDDMGTFRTTIGIENPLHPGQVHQVADVMVDTGSEYTWIPRDILAKAALQPMRIVRFVTADGRFVDRSVCFGNVYAGHTSAPDILVFAEPGDLALLGARALEGLNLRVDLTTRQLVPAGPVPAASGLAA